MRLRFLIAAALAVVVAACQVQPAAAAAGVQADVTTRAVGTYTGANDLGSVYFAFDLLKLNQLSPGTGTSKADKLFSDERTIAASGSENLDLAGVLTDPFGATLTFVKVKAIMIVADVGNTNSVCVGGHATAAFPGPFSDVTDVVCIPPGSSFLMTHAGAGWTVTATTGDLIKVANSGGTTGVTYKVIIIGTSA